MDMRRSDQHRGCPVREEDSMSQQRVGRAARHPRPVIIRSPYTFHLDRTLVERARREVGEQDVVRSIEAALAAAVDYQAWVREVTAGRRDRLA
jgi:hypothetical protein